MLELDLTSPKLTAKNLRRRWPELVRVAEQGRSGPWKPSFAGRTRAAYSLFVADLVRAGDAIEGNDLPAFRAALRPAKKHLAAVDALVKRSRLVCKIVSKNGSTLTFGA